MSTLRVNNITDTSGGSSSLSVPGAAKAWVNFNGTGTVAIRAQMNVSSITDNGTGDYTVNFTTAMTDANYAVCGSGGDPGNRDGGIMAPTQALATTSTRIRGFGSNALDTKIDLSVISVSIFR
jgi:hypothetical protein